MGWSYSPEARHREGGGLAGQEDVGALGREHDLAALVLLTGGLGRDVARWLCKGRGATGRSPVRGSS